MNLSGVTKLSAGSSHMCAVKGDRTVWCWGANGTNGQLGDGSYVQKSTPVMVPGITNAIDVGAGEIHTCALLDDGSVTCWGFGGHGELADGILTPKTLVAPALACAAQ
jgi:alpha-tubulin suppressor-like RCC1 family protein